VDEDLLYRFYVCLMWIGDGVAAQFQIHENAGLEKEKKAKKFEKVDLAKIDTWRRFYDRVVTSDERNFCSRHRR
jgi:hypothetical protein